MQPDVLAEIRAIPNDREAFDRLRIAFGWPNGKVIARASTSEVGEWIGLLGTLAGKQGAAQLEELSRAVVADPDSPDRLYDLGFALIDAGVPAVAATVLWRCLSLVGDSEEVVCELVSALETAMAYEDAFAILAERAALREGSFLCQYLYAFDAAMTGRLDVVREVVGKLDATTPEHVSMKSTIERILERVDQVAGLAKLDRSDLRGWHYVLTGGLLLHRSVHGFPDPMNGRFAWLQDSYERIATGLDRLRGLVASVPCVYAVEGRDHEILAHAVAQRLGLPLAPWPTIGVPAPGLIVAYSLGELPRSTLSVLSQRRADQILFAHHSPWTHDFPIAPDVTTLLAQALRKPWDEWVKIDPTTHDVARTPADDRPVEVIGAEIAASAGLDASELLGDEPELDALVSRVWPLDQGVRTRLWAGGPVPSNRFD
jgi:hypothetical protein